MKVTEIAMTNTRDKLNETKFFLKCLKYATTNFPYYLSAFLTAARSITYFMQKEYAHVKGFSKWYLEKQSYMKNEPIMKILHNKRNMTAHKNPINPLEQIISTTVKEVKTAYGGTSEINNNGDVVHYPPPIPFKTKRIIYKNIKWYYDDYLELDVLSISKKQCAILEIMVDDCEASFYNQLLSNQIISENQ